MSENIATDIIFRCVPGVCNNFNPGNSFDAGFSHPDADAANFNPNLVSCTNLMPTSHPDPQIAGKPALGSKCSIEWYDSYYYNKIYRPHSQKKGNFT